MKGKYIIRPIEPLMGDKVIVSGENSCIKTMEGVFYVRQKTALFVRRKNQHQSKTYLAFYVDDDSEESALLFVFKRTVSAYVPDKKHTDIARCKGKRAAKRHWPIIFDCINFFGNEIDELEMNNVLTFDFEEK